MAFGFRTWRTTRLGPIQRLGFELAPAAGVNDQSIRPVSPSMASSSAVAPPAEDAVADDPEVVQASPTARRPPCGAARPWRTGSGRRGRARGRRGRTARRPSPWRARRATQPVVGRRDHAVGQVADPDRLAPRSAVQAECPSPGRSAERSSVGQEDPADARRRRHALGGDRPEPARPSGPTSGGTAASARRLGVVARHRGRRAAAPADRRPASRRSPSAPSSRRDGREPGRAGGSVAGGHPEPLRLVGAGQAQQGPCAVRVVGGDRQQPLVGCAASAGRSSSSWSSPRASSASGTTAATG